MVERQRTAEYDEVCLGLDAANLAKTIGAGNAVVTQEAEWIGVDSDRVIREANRLSAPGAVAALQYKKVSEGIQSIIPISVAAPEELLEEDGFLRTLRSGAIKIPRCL